MERLPEQVAHTLITIIKNAVTFYRAL